MSKSCNVCGEVETEMHIIYECRFVQNIWNKISQYLNVRITAEKIIFGTNLNWILNNLLSQIAYSIHKYWIIRNEENVNSCEVDLEVVVKNDLKYKASIFKFIKNMQLYKEYNNALVVLFPHR